MSDYKERARKWLQEHDYWNSVFEQSLAKEFREVAAEAEYRATVENKELMSLYRKQVTTFSEGRHMGLREGWRRACERCAEAVGVAGGAVCAIEPRHGGFSCHREDFSVCRRLADNYEEPK